jgi:putative transposase
VARCTVERLMAQMSLRGATRGRAWITTTQPGPADEPRRDLVDRQFVATGPNQLWVSDFTYVATWRGFVYVAFVIDTARLFGPIGYVPPDEHEARYYAQALIA